MKNSTLIKLFVMLAVVMFVIVAILNYWKPGAPETAKDLPASVKVPDYSSTHKPPALGAAQPKPVQEPEAGDVALPKLPREQVEAWLKLHGRDAVSLLAAFRAMGDTNYLNEAALNFPNDPKVEWTVLAQAEFPADRRKWLNLFKQSSPDNAVADYLSAEEYFKNGQPDAALRELQAASDKVGFDNFENESRETSEDLYAFLGKTKLEAAQMSLAAIAGDTMPTLAAFKRVGQGIADLQKKALDTGDMDSVADLYEMGTTLVDNLQNGDGGDYVINQLAAIADQDILLSPLDKDANYEFLDDQTAGQMMQELKDQKNSITQLLKSFNEIYPSLSQEDMLDYAERVKDDGELDAMQWVVEQHPQTSR